MAVAHYCDCGGWTAHTPESVDDPATLLRRLLERANGEAVLVGFDFPIGLPIAYACQKGITDFLKALPLLPDSFYEPANSREDISLDRPFYPYNSKIKGEKKQSHLTQRLGLTNFNQMSRKCESPDTGRKAACLFWTLGPNQVGKGALAGWQYCLKPALSCDSLDIKVWPFDGDLPDLLRPNRVVITETYPGEIYSWFDLDIGGRRKGKTKLDHLQTLAPEILKVFEKMGIKADTKLKKVICDGFRKGDKANDDDFDAVIGLLGMASVVFDQRPSGFPPNKSLRSVEGWILGRGNGATPGLR